jgi:hypothetical protein
VISRHGYRADDIVDETADVEGTFGGSVLSDGTSIEARLAAIVRGRTPSAEVRETAGVYRVARLGRRIGAATRAASAERV